MRRHEGHEGHEAAIDWVAVRRQPSREPFAFFGPFVFLVFVVFSSSACETPPARAEQAPAAALSWRPLGTWSGHGDRQSDSFDVVTGAMRLRWQTSGGSDAGQGRFRVTLYSAISGRPLQVIVDRTGPGADTAFIEDEPRVSYLVIESDRVDWTATLEEALATGK